MRFGGLATVAPWLASAEAYRDAPGRGDWMTTRRGLVCLGALLAHDAARRRRRRSTRTAPSPSSCHSRRVGLTDVPARVLATMMPEKIGQNVVVENKTGGTGTIGVAYVARSAPDGYTLLANSLSDAQNLHFMPVPTTPSTILPRSAGSSMGRRSCSHRRRACRTRRSPSSIPAPKPIRTRSASARRGRLVTGDGDRADQQGRRYQHCGVPYRGSGEAARAVVTGAIQGVFTFYSQAKPLVDDGKLRALAVAAPSGSPAGRTFRPSRNLATRSISAALSACQRRPRRRSRSSNTSTRSSTRWCSPTRSSRGWRRSA